MELGELKKVATIEDMIKEVQELAPRLFALLQEIGYKMGFEDGTAVASMGGDPRDE